jgi:hypothetical protein
MLSLSNLYPRGELASPPPARPLREPSLVSSVDDCDYNRAPFARSTFVYGCRSAGPVRRKRESYNLSGSIFLITSSGKILNLPVPSESPADPLNWGRWKTAGAIIAVVWYSVVSLPVVQAASMVYHGILVEFHDRVCEQLESPVNL